MPVRRLTEGARFGNCPGDARRRVAGQLGQDVPPPIEDVAGDGVGRLMRVVAQAGVQVLLLDLQRGHGPPVLELHGLAQARVVDERRHRRVLGLFFVGSVLFFGGLAGAWRAGQFGGPLWRVAIACVSVGIGGICLLVGLVTRRRRD